MEAAIVMSVIALIGSIVSGIFQLFDSGVECTDVKSNCCVFGTEIEDIEQKTVK